MILYLNQIYNIRKKNIFLFLYKKMSRLYNLIEQQAINVMKLIINQQTDQENVQWYLQYGGPIVSAIATLVFLLVIFVFGLFLWNQGLHAVMPNVVAQIGGGMYNQYNNPYTQLIVTLIALMMILS
jgi:hypothetical protein